MLTLINSYNNTYTFPFSASRALLAKSFSRSTNLPITRRIRTLALAILSAIPLINVILWDYLRCTYSSMNNKIILYTEALSEKSLRINYLITRDSRFIELSDDNKLILLIAASNYYENLNCPQNTQIQMLLQKTGIETVIYNFINTYCHKQRYPTYAYRYHDLDKSVDNILMLAVLQKLRTTENLELKKAVMSSIPTRWIEKIDSELLPFLPENKIIDLSEEQFSQLTPSQLRTVTETCNNRYQRLRPREVNNFLIFIKGHYPSELTRNLDLLSPAQIRYLNDEFIPHLPFLQFEHLTPAQFTQLTPAQIKMIPDRLVHKYSDAQIQSLPNTWYSTGICTNLYKRLGDGEINSFLMILERDYPANVTYHLSILSPPQVTGLSDTFISMLPASQFKHLSEQQFQKLSPSQLRMIASSQTRLFQNLSSSKINDFLIFIKSNYNNELTHHLSFLGPLQIQTLADEFISNLPALQLQYLTAEQLVTLPPHQILLAVEKNNRLLTSFPTIEIFHLLSFVKLNCDHKLPFILGLLTGTQIGLLDDEFLTSLPFSQYGILSPEQFTKLPSDKLKMIPESLAHLITDDQINAFSDIWHTTHICKNLYIRLGKAQINGFLSFIERDHPALLEYKLSILTPEQVKNLDDKFIDKLPLSKFKHLSPEQFTKLTPIQIRVIPDHMAPVFSDAQIHAFPDTWYVVGMCTNLYKRLNPTQINDFLKFIKINHNHSLRNNLKLLSPAQVKSLDNEFLPNLYDYQFDHLSEEQTEYLLNSLDINVVKRISEFHRFKPDLDINSPLGMLIYIKYIESHPDLTDRKNPFVIYQKIQKSQVEDTVEITSPQLILGEKTYKLDLVTIADARKRIAKKWTFSELEATLGAPALKKEELETWFRSLDDRKDQINETLAATGIRTLAELEDVLCRQSSNWLVSGLPTDTLTDQVLQFNVCIRTLLKKAIETPRDAESPLSDEELALLKTANVFIFCPGGRVEQLRTTNTLLKPFFPLQFQDAGVSTRLSLNVLLDLYRTTAHEYLKGINYKNPHESEYVLNMIGLRIGLLNQTIVYDQATDCLSDDLATKSVKELIDDVLQNPAFFESFIESVRIKLCTILPEGPSQQDIFTGEETMEIFDAKYDSGGYSFQMDFQDIPEGTPFVTRTGAIRALAAVGILKQIDPHEDTTYVSLPPNIVL